MYIKQIIIQGFKSYRDRIVVEPFDPRHNVIVGRNGSGKSNFFSAIQFVLSDEYSHLKPQQRQLLLHDGTALRVINAYVEIIFDNTDGRFPIDKKEIYLRRVIGSKKDNYFLNKTTVSRSEVANLLESAGLSRSNPYYIVKQGEINQMTIATDSQRLKLLREVAGTRVYDEKTVETKIILEETQGKLVKAEEVLRNIEERLEALEAEKNELKEYHRWDKQRRCLEYTIYQRESEETKRKLMALHESHEASFAEQQTFGKMVKEAENNISSMIDSWKMAKDRVKMAQREQGQQTEELQSLLQKATKLSLTMNDLREEIKSNEEDKSRAASELEDLQQIINEKTKELEAINPEYKKLLKEEEKLMRNLTMKEEQRKELYVKQGRSAQFHSKEARDEWIKEQLDQLAKQIEVKQAHCVEIQENLANDREKQATFEKRIETEKTEMEQLKRLMESHEDERYKEIEEKEEAQSTLKELYRRESTLQAELTNKKENLLQVEQTLRFLAGKQIFNGRESVRKVLESFRETPGMSEIVDGYYGQVIDNFTCDSGAYTAVEVIAGKRLFHHIVESDEFGTKILKEMNKQGLPGEVTFMPLNRLKVNTPNYPDSNDVIPMMTKLVYDAKYDKALRFIFGKTLICRNLEIATTIARSSGLDCVTTDGDLVSSKGFLTGGYYKRDKTPLGDYKTLTDVTRKISELERNLTTMKSEIGMLTGVISSHIRKIQRAEAIISRSKNNYDKMEADICATKIELDAIQSWRIPKEKSLAQCTSSLEALKATKVGLERELNQDLTSQLSPAEHNLLNTLNKDIRSLTKQNKMIFEKRLKCEREKTKLENLLTNNLTRRRDELTHILQNLSAKERQHQLESYLRQLVKAEDETKFLEREMVTGSNKVTDAMQKLKSISEELEKWKIVKKDAQAKLEENAKVLEKFTSKKYIYEQKIAELNEKITKLGALPSLAAYEKFTKMPNKDLFKELNKTNDQLKRYSHVNKKALDQFLSSSDQRDKLIKRKEELDRANEKIHELMLTLEEQKYRAIQFTFKQVSKYFSEVFQKLEPSGHGNLVMKTANNENDENESSEVASSDSFIGVGIRVSFTNQATKMSEMNQLSGGQKSLVALALIFAIQKCDPAPFYLFDEIDQALDAQHREAVANMIHELSSSAQFITTTFKPEMLRQANKFYGIKYGNKVSQIEPVTQEEAANFVEGDKNEGQ